MISKVRGTQDFLDLTLYNYITSTLRANLVRNNFHEIATPLLEHVELFKRSLGLHTDVVSKQMFLIAAHEQDAEQLCLRPEATASTMRAFLEQLHSITLPWKVFSSGPIFRYERPQKGRYRQFHQCNIEVIGSNSIWQDAYLIAMLDRVFQHDFSLDTYALTINFLGCPTDRVRFKESLYSFLHTRAALLCSTCQQRKESNILRVFDCKQETRQAQYAQAPMLLDHLCASCSGEWQTLKHTLDILSVSFSVVPTLVRGLDYYDKTVFEFVSTALGAQSAFCGGGRYNHLAGELGSKTHYPAIGAGIGIERLMLLLEPIQDRLQLPVQPQLTVIIPLDQEQCDLAVLLADQLQSHGVCVDVLLEGESLKSKLRKADKFGATHVVLIGSEEQEAGLVVVKNMRTGTEEKIKQIELVRYLK